MDPKQPKRPAASRWAAAAIACGVVIAVFPDVVFFGASLSNLQVLGFFEPKPTTLALIPEEDGRTIWDGYRDPGAAAWQLEPAQRFIRRCLVEGESPYWNPYSSSGTHGPERLASASFSVLTVSTALLGAGTRGLHVVLLIAFFIAVYCLYRTLTVFLGRSATAAIAGCFAFLLAGFHISGLGAQMLHPYILGPILLHALLALSIAPTPWRFAGAVLATSLLLAETFLPTTLLTLICVHALCLAGSARRWSAPLRDGVRQLVVQGVVSVLGLLLLAPLVFPLLESLPLSEWRDRPFGTARPRAALSLATPKHFWESYRGFERTRNFDNAALHINRIEATRVYHLGVTALLVAVQAFATRRSRRNPLVLVAGFLMAIAVGRLFGVFPMTWIEHLPVFDKISIQYWGVMWCFPFCILLAHGLDALSPKTVWKLPTLALLGFFGACFSFLINRLGLPDAGPALLHLRVFGALVAAVLLAFFALCIRPGWRPGVTIFLVLLLAGELIFYMNRLRPERHDLDFNRLGFVNYLRTHLKNERVLNIGSRGLYPNWGSGLAIPQIGSLDAVNLRWYGDFFDRRFGKSGVFLALRRERSRDTPEQLKMFDLDALDLLGVRYVLVSGAANYQKFFTDQGFMRVLRKGGISIFENPDPFPRAFVVGALMKAPGIPSDRGYSGRRLVFTTDPELLGAAAKLEISSRAPSGSDVSELESGSVEISEYRHARIVLQASLVEPAVVVLADTWHPSWQARVDGEPVHLGRVDEVLRGVALPAGRHQIIMTYAPRSLPFALIVSLITVAFLVFRVWAASRRRLDSGAASP